jgi:hypothetical protein
MLKQILKSPDRAGATPINYIASRPPINPERIRGCPLPPSLRYGATSEFMDGLNYTTVIELAEPLARLSRRSGAKTDRRGSQLRSCRAALMQAALDR